MKTTVKLDRIKYAVEQWIDADLTDELAELPRTEVEYNPILRQALIRLTYRFWGKVIEERRITYPANWIEAIKDRWLPAWAEKYWPTKYTTHVIDLSAIYPQIKLPEEGRFFLSSDRRYDWHKVGDLDI